MASASFQCPDSGLIVIVEETKGGGYAARGDPDDWRDMGAEADTIAATEQWIEDANRALFLRKPRKGDIAGVERALRPLGVVESDLDSLTWAR